MNIPQGYLIISETGFETFETWHENEALEIIYVITSFLSIGIKGIDGLNYGYYKVCDLNGQLLRKTSDFETIKNWNQDFISSMERKL